MTRVEIRPFRDDDVAEAGRLLAERHTKHRQAEPLLSPRFESGDLAAEEVAEVWKEPGAAGAVAVHEGRLVGYLLGAPKASPVWGPNVWVEAAGQATADAELMRDLYAAAAAEWVDRGLTAHYVLVPSSDDALLNAWYRLGFGQQHAHAIRALPADPPRLARVSIRLATRADIPSLARLDLVLPEHHKLAPTLSAGELPTLEAAIHEWESDFDDDAFHTVVAEYGGRVIGSAVGCALEKSGSHISLARPDNAGFLGFAAVLPEARGLGAGRALGEAVIAWTAEAGFACIVTDWRVTNLLSSRTWPALGFRTSFLRLHRLIGY